MHKGKKRRAPTRARPCSPAVSSCAFPGCFRCRPSRNGSLPFSGLLLFQRRRRLSLPHCIPILLHTRLTCAPRLTHRLETSTFAVRCSGRAVDMLCRPSFVAYQTCRDTHGSDAPAKCHNERLEFDRCTEDF